MLLLPLMRSFSFQSSFKTTTIENFATLSLKELAFKKNLFSLRGWQDRRDMFVCCLLQDEVTFVLLSFIGELNLDNYQNNSNYGNKGKSFPLLFTSDVFEAIKTRRNWLDLFVIFWHDTSRLQLSNLHCSVSHPSYLKALQASA